MVRERGQGTGGPLLPAGSSDGGSEVGTTWTKEVVSMGVASGSGGQRRGQGR